MNNLKPKKNKRNSKYYTTGLIGENFQKFKKFKQLRAVKTKLLMLRQGVFSSSEGTRRSKTENIRRDNISVASHEMQE
jgi:hypothetical protein